MQNGLIRLLLIEDDADDVLFIRRALTEAVGPGFMFQLSCAPTLTEALERLEKDEPDVVVADLTLPDSQGLGTLLSVRERARETPVVVLTGMSDEAMGFKAVSLGAQDYLVKGSITGSSLRRALIYACQRSRLVRRLETVVENSPDGIVVVDERGLVQYVNPSAQRLLESEGGLREGHPFRWMAAAGRTTEIAVPWRSGERRMLEMRVNRTEWRGRPALLATLRDVTELKKLEELRIALRDQRRVHQRV